MNILAGGPGAVCASRDASALEHCGRREDSAPSFLLGSSAGVLRAPTPPERFVDARGRPYVLWDVELTLDEYRAKLASPDREEAAYWLGRALRDAEPDDVLELVSWAQIAEAWPLASRYVGRQRPFWRWWLEQVGHAVDAE